MNTRINRSTRLRAAARLSAIAAALAAAPAMAQSLFQRPVAPQPVAPPPATQPPASTPANSGDSGNPGKGNGSSPAAASPAPVMQSAQVTLADASLFHVNIPKPKTFQKHDKIELIINETSLQKSEQSLEAKKQYDLKAELTQFPSLKKLIEDATLTDGIGGNPPNVGVNSTNNYKGDGKSERKDNFKARISATVIDVKPNGHLVLEATESQQFDSEIKTLVVSGTCDPKDITQQGTVQSSQLVGLVIKVNHEGTLRDTSEKGILSRILDAIFNF